MSVETRKKKENYQQTGWKSIERRMATKRATEHNWQNKQQTKYHCEARIQHNSEQRKKRKSEKHNDSQNKKKILLKTKEFFFVSQISWQTTTTTRSDRRRKNDQRKGKQNILQQNCKIEKRDIEIHTTVCVWCGMDCEKLLKQITSSQHVLNKLSFSPARSSSHSHACQAPTRIEMITKIFPIFLLFFVWVCAPLSLSSSFRPLLPLFFFLASIHLYYPFLDKLNDSLVFDLI